MTKKTNIKIENLIGHLIIIGETDQVAQQQIAKTVEETLLKAMRNAAIVNSKEERIKKTLNKGKGSFNSIEEIEKWYNASMLRIIKNSEKTKDQNFEKELKLTLVKIILKSL